jgi:hypothetical protein
VCSSQPLDDVQTSTSLQVVCCLLCDCVHNACAMCAPCLTLCAPQSSRSVSPVDGALGDVLLRANSGTNARYVCGVVCVLTLGVQCNV